MIPYQATAASVPEPSMRGSFSAIGAAIQQLSGGVAAVLAGYLVSTGADGKLEGFVNVGYVVIASTFIAGFLVHRVHRGIIQREAGAVPAAALK